MEQKPEFIIGLSPDAKATFENLIASGMDCHAVLLQLTYWIEPTFVDLEQPEQPEPEQADTTEQPEPEISQN
jgi:hypothetical protein